MSGLLRSRENSSGRRHSLPLSFNASLAYMLATFVALSLCLLSANAEDSQSVSNVACPAEQLGVTPCRCCKMDCWYAISKSATHELGHIPGQEGEDEAMATLRLIRACMISQCSSVCPPAGPRLFRPSSGLNRERPTFSLGSARPRPIIPMA
ncbi:hypothetical protein DdX_04997 [Ditylenchus destructor]|uniref:Uncharacterized protein n=1 Tax=Ditylenchus destructor TaxID=166010 RepID=A0AAD4NDX6_9BILA|nr:hypothetical protein DdX_04997 [Ditylenchus destructor]